VNLSFAGHSGLNILSNTARRANRKTTRIEPAAAGERVDVKFPMCSRTLDELDAWLGDHPLCRLVAIGHLPGGRTQARLMQMLQKRKVSLLVVNR
jgi:hypothetical protein